MPDVDYTYSISADVPAGQVDAARLETEILASPITTALAGVSTDGDVLTVTFKTGLPGIDKTILDNDTTAPAGGLIGAHSGVPLPAVDVVTVAELPETQVDGTPLFAMKGRFGKEVIYATHNLCDETTWYSESTRVTEKALTTSDSLTYDSGDPYWIDMTHGKVFDEEGLIEDQQILNPQDAHGYGIVVEVEEDPIGAPGVWTEKTQRAAWAQSGGDYTVDYVAGTVTFDQSQTGKNVRASYSKKATSGWVLRPLPGKALFIEKAEIQFAVDIDMTATFVIEALGHVIFFAPHLAQSNGGPLPDDTPVPIDTTYYKTIDQIIDEAIMAFPPIPVLSQGSRGFSKERHVFQFHYATMRTLWSSLGMHLRISVEGDVSYGGERATATFYCTAEDDTDPLAALNKLSS